MKKLLVLLFSIIALCSSQSFAEEEIKSFDLNKLRIGMPFIKCLDIINREGVEFESVREDHPYICVPAHLFGETDLGGADLLFDGDNNLECISFDAWFDTTRDAYDAISKELGNADIVYVSDYLDNDVRDDYAESGFPVYIVWIREDAVCELSIYSSFEVNVKTSFLSGSEVEIEDTLSQRFDVRIYHPKLFDEFSHLYE